MAPSSWTNAPLTSFDLEAAFQHYFGEKVSHADWIEPGQVQMQGKHEVVEALIGALKKFRSPEAGGKQPVYTHEKAQLVITAQTTSSPGPGRAPPSPQTEKPSCAPASEQAQRFEQPNPNTQQAYNQGPNHNYRPAAQAQSYAQDPQSFSQNQAGYQPAYAQAQGSPNYPYATPQQHARSPYPAVSILLLHRHYFACPHNSFALDHLCTWHCQLSAQQVALLVAMRCLLLVVKCGCSPRYTMKF